MKLLQILFSGPGGQASVAFSLQEADHEHDFQHQMLFYGNVPLWPAYKGCCVNRKLDYRVVQKKQGLDLPSWKRVYRSLKELKPDAVILHSTNLILPVWWYCKRHNIKCLVVEHTSNDVKRKIEHWFSKLSLILATKMVYLTSDSRKNNYERYHKKQILNSPIIANGIDHQIYSRKGELSDEPVMLSMIARFSIQKNQLMLVRTMKHLPGFHLTLAGHGETWEEVSRLVQELQLEDRVHLPGMLNEKEIVVLLNQTSLYIHCSFGETLPTSVLQAMSCSLPVMASNIPGLNDLIVENSNGFLFQNDSEEQLAEQIKQFIENRNQRIAFGERSRQIIEQNFTKESMFEKYRKLVLEK